MQAINQSDPMSWYQIAGIHGMPYVPWDDVQAAPGQDDNGYCAHYSTLFLTWHRPYLALFEQVLYEKVTEAANEFPVGALRQRSLPRSQSEKRDTEASPTTKEASLANATTSTGARRQYITIIRADKMGLGDSFSVYIFVGPFNDSDSSGWQSEPNLVGTHGFFANLGGMKTKVPLMASGTVPLTSILADKVESGKLSGLGVEEVSAYLKQNLSWRVMKVTTIRLTLRFCVCHHAYVDA
ncbi:MAG: hypothetical protein Q9165_004802 [Trypethelium subeluteriae]